MSMVVYKYLVSDEAIISAKERTRQLSAFRATDLVNALNESNVHPFASYRAADRLLQKWRKAGEIKYHNGKWRWCSGETK